MAALIALVLILAIFGGLGFAAHVLWYVLIIAVLLWLIGFFVGGVADGGGTALVRTLGVRGAIAWNWHDRQTTSSRSSARSCQGRPRGGLVSSRGALLQRRGRLPARDAAVHR